MTALTTSLRLRLRSNRRWVKLRRLKREGLISAWKRLNLWKRILATPATITGDLDADAPIEVHLLCWEGDYLGAIWALKTFYYWADRKLPLLIHFNGELSPVIERRLRYHFPKARLIAQAEADRLVEASLASRSFNGLLAERRSNPFMMKLTDFLIISRSSRILILDSDLLFFAQPAELLKLMDLPQSANTFMEDATSSSNISASEALDRFGLRLETRINSGLALLERAAISLELCERVLPHLTGESGWKEQTLYALAASAGGSVRRLSKDYLVSLEKGLSNKTLIARHYAGPSRPFFTTEGLPYLLKDRRFFERLAKRAAA